MGYIKKVIIWQKFSSDTCMVVSPACEKFTRKKAKSGKTHKYAPNLCGAKSIMAPTEEYVKAAVSGEG